MLCLTFTNRAAREMRRRVAEYMGEVPPGLFVGNLHRFCLRYLFANEVIHPDSTIIADEDLAAYASTYFPNIPENAFVARFMAVCDAVERRRLGFPPALLSDIETKTQINDREYAMADNYRAYKQHNRLIDFDDILRLAYAHMEATPPEQRRRYSWIQVDEVQDISPLQLALIDLCTAPDATVMYLGDEQQAIFTFLGAGPRVLEKLRRRCSGNIHHLLRNYRSPGELVRLCNVLASDYLGINPELLPEPVEDSGGPGTLSFYMANSATLAAKATRRATDLLRDYPGEDVAVLVRTNREALALSEYMEMSGVEHLVFSQHDDFKGVDFGTIWSHLAVCLNPARRDCWARLLYQTKTTRTLTAARKLLDDLSLAGVGPDELLDFGRSTLVERFCKICSSDADIVVFDTETTGLDIFNDDIVQISALRIRKGRIVPDSRFEVFIASPRPLPQMLGDIPNPLIERYEAAEKLTPTEALSRFTDYVGNAFLAGHNLSFDLPILRRNVSRLTGLSLTSPFAKESESVDTLRLSNLLAPEARSHTLASMIRYFGIEGINSHDASDDVLATANLLLALRQAAISSLGAIYLLREDASVKRMAMTFASKYGPMHAHTCALLEDPSEDAVHTLAAVINDTYLRLIAMNAIRPIRNFHYILELIETAVVDDTLETTFRDQLTAHLNDLLTFNEGDLYNLGIVREKLSIMTIHKAKGLEMPHVVVYNMGNWFGDYQEHLRVLYVAFSRARKTLTVGVSGRLGPRLRELLGRFKYLDI